MVHRELKGEIGKMSVTTKFMIAIFAVFIVSIWALSLLKILLHLTIAPKFGMRCCTISGFGLLFMNEDGRWKCAKDKFSPIIQDVLIVDISKPVPDDIDKKERHYLLFCKTMEVLFSVVLFLLLKDRVRATMVWEGVSGVDLFLGSFAYGVIFQAFCHFIITVYVQIMVTKNLGGYVNSLLKKLRQGVSFEAMGLKPVSQLPYKKPNNIEKMMYYQIYVPYLISTGDIDGLKEPIEEMRKYFAKRDYIIQETLSYYWLIFYYSRYELISVNADAFYTRVSGTLLNDPDANAKRVLAYYYYGVKNDVEKARQYIREGLAVIDKFSAPGAERELERKLLLELDEIIIRRLAYEQQNNEKI